MATVATQERVEEQQTLISTSNLRAQKNSLLPVFRLPPEILDIIFTHGARDFYERCKYYAFSVPHWVNISYVCRHWRIVALNCPTLWTYHFTASLRWTEELLARSRQALLKICIHRSCDHFLKMVLNHAERIQELCLTVSGDALSKVFSSYAPRLQILELHGKHSESPPTINNGHILPLRTLRLHGSSLPWYSFNLSRVTTLFLRYASPVPKQNIAETLTTLSRMQALTDLHLEYSLPIAHGLLSDGTSNIFPKVSLPRLSRLVIHERLWTVVAFLSCIRIPLETRLYLGIGEENDGSSVDEFMHILPPLAQIFGQSETSLRSSCPIIHSLVINFSGCITITTSKREDYDNPEMNYASLPQDDNIPLIISIGVLEIMTHAFVYRIVSGICCCVPLTHVQTLHISNPPPTCGFWKKMLGHLTGLRRMKLSRGHIPDLASWLTLPADEQMEDGGNRAPRFVPALEELELYRTTFKSTSTKESLLDMLATRPLRLIMTQCYVSKT